MADKLKKLVLYRSYWAPILFVILTVASLGHAEDWSSCADDLDRLRRASRDAADAAEQAESARQEFESEKEELENCLTFPDIYDLMEDNCQSFRWDYQSAKDDYESALYNLESELDTLARRIRSVEWSCGMEFTRSSGDRQTNNYNKALCDYYGVLADYYRDKGRIPSNLLEECKKKGMSESDCRRCLGIK